VRRIIAAVLGFLAASLVPALILAVGTPLVGDLTSRLRWALIFFLYSAAATLILGVPFFLMFLGFKRVRWWSALCVGAAIGAVVDEVLLSESTNRMRGALLFAAIGAAAGLTFWIVWKRCGGEGRADPSGQFGTRESEKQE
jgi:hypothetical protein